MIRYGRVICLLGGLLGATAQAEVVVRFDLPAKSVQAYRKPYVAVWVENGAGEPVRSLAVWHRQSDWLKDLTRWWRKLGRNAGPGLDGVSGATRAPGGYRLVWDGRDRHGRRVPAGQYVVQLEAVREFGGRSLISVPIELGSTAQRYSRPSAAEIGPVVVETGVHP